MNEHLAAHLSRPGHAGNTFWPVHDWTSARGHTVEVWHATFPTRTGVVEDVTADGSVLWLAAHGPDLRIMVEKAEGYEIWSV